MDWWRPEYAFPILGAVVAGALIGFDREYRGRAAGLRTHILVSLTSALLMLAAVHQVRWMTDTPHDVIRIDPVRMAHGVLTGIGFLCGGVIFREGFNVRGLTTAASLWSTATLGMLFGIGFHELAIFGAAATFLVLAAVAITEKYAPQRRIAHIKAGFDRQAAITAPDFGRMLAAQGLKYITIDQQLEDDELSFYAIVDGYAEERAQRLADQWISDPGIRCFEIRPQQA